MKQREADVRGSGGGEVEVSAQVQVSELRLNKCDGKNWMQSTSH